MQYKIYLLNILECIHLIREFDDRCNVIFVVDFCYKLHSVSKVTPLLYTKQIPFSHSATPLFLSHPATPSF